MLTSVRTLVQESSQVGEARRAINDICVRMGGDATFCGRASLVGTELARNLVLHGGGGEIISRSLSEPGLPGIEIMSLDHGPGLRNVAACLRDGYSTAGTPGTGLGAIQRLSDLFELNTSEERGTAICVRLFQRRDERENCRRLGAISVPLTGQQLCGDSWSLLDQPTGVRVLVADGLGHGAFAAEASLEAVKTFRANPLKPLGEVLLLIHDALKKTRGAAAAIAEIDVSRREVTVTGVGNISVRVFDSVGTSRQLASANGTLGAAATRIQQFTAAWSADSLLAIHSDGLSSNWSPSVYPGLIKRHPALIAGVIYRDFSRDRDDATIVVVSCPK